VTKATSVRIVCLSDTHGLHRRLTLPQADILIHSGDFMVHGRSTDEIDDFNAWLGSLPHKHKIVIAGNHDLLFEVRPTEARARIINAVYLEDTGVTLEGLNFWGSPVTPVFGDWAFAADRGAAIRRHWDKIPDDTDVLVTHGPPFGTLDKPDILAPHFGCQELTKAVIRTKPRLHVLWTRARRLWSGVRMERHAIGELCGPQRSLRTYQSTHCDRSHSMTLLLEYSSSKPIFLCT
jgi:Icc-related predicted phosphoesterase